MNCPNCGTSNLDDARICINCGRPLTVSYTPPPPPPPPRPVGEGYTPPPPPQPAGQPIPNYLWQSIVVTLCCCLPFGVVGIVYAVMVNNKLAAGDVAGAAEASRNAKLWVIVAFAVGLIVWILWFALSGAAFIQGIREGMQS